MLSDRLTRLYRITAFAASSALQDAALSNEDISSRTALATRLRDGLEECNAERRRLIHLDIALRKRLAAITTYLSCIQRLPDDILRLIFECIKSNFKNPYHCVDYFASTICTVSRRWRMVAQSTASLWTHLSLRRARVVTIRGIPRRTTPWNHFAALTPLCASAPIHIRWNWDFDFSPLVVLLAKLPNALQALDLSAQWESLVFLESDVFRSLERLDLTLCGGLYQFVLDHINVLSRLTRLHVLYNEDGRFARSRPSAPTLPNLLDLSMRLTPGPPSSFVYDTLRGCANLTSLELRCSFSDGVPRDSASIRLERLTSLHLADSACCLLRTIIAPQVLDLSLSVVDDNDVQGSLFAAIDDLVTNSACLLTTLTFSRVWCSADSDDMDRCLQHIPAVSALYVDDSWDASAAGSFGEELMQRLARGNDVVLPKLLKADLRGPCYHYRARVTAAITAFWVSRTGERADVMGVEALKEFYSSISTSNV